MHEADTRIIRLAQPSDVDAMREIEQAAGRLFAEIGMDEIAADEPPSRAMLLEYIHEGRAWIVEIAGTRAGYALADIVDGRGHVEQVSVDPDYGRQGIGRDLIETIGQWARGRGLEALTLCTFRDVSWNGPYYERLGFRPLQDAELTPGLRALRAHERELGLDVTARQAMRLDLSVDAEGGLRRGDPATIL